MSHLEWNKGPNSGWVGLDPLYARIRFDRGPAESFKDLSWLEEVDTCVETERISIPTSISRNEGYISKHTKESIWFFPGDLCNY